MLLLSIVHKKLFFQFRKFSDLFVFIQTGNLTLAYLEGEMDPRYSWFYKFLVTHPDFMKFSDFSKISSGINILEFFFKIGAVFCSVITFSRTSVISVYMFCWNDEYTSLTLIVVF